MIENSIEIHLPFGTSKKELFELKELFEEIPSEDDIFIHTVKSDLPENKLDRTVKSMSPDYLPIIKIVAEVAFSTTFLNSVFSYLKARKDERLIKIKYTDRKGKSFITVFYRDKDEQSKETIEDIVDKLK